ncbi:MAG: hypothetical protein ACJ8FU_03185, partial [Xanthobacteraceae bacterium]
MKDLGQRGPPLLIGVVTECRDDRIDHGRRFFTGRSEKSWRHLGKLCPPSRIGGREFLDNEVDGEGG